MQATFRGKSCPNNQVSTSFPQTSHLQVAMSGMQTKQDTVLM